MTFRRQLAALLLLALAEPATASTLPDVGLPAGHVAATLGLADVGVDYAVTDRLQVGAGAAGNLHLYGGYGRVTYSLDDTWGLHAAAGHLQGLIFQVPGGPFLFLGPVAAWKLGRFVTVLASLGGNSNVGWRNRF